MSINAVYEDGQGNVHESRLDGVDLTTKISIANDFSTSVNYAVGDFCYHLGMLYKCTTAHTAGAWDATHFTATQVGDEIGELKNTLIDQTAGETFIIVTSLMPLFHDSINYSGYVSFPFVTKNDNYTITLNGVMQNNVGDVTNNTTVTVKKNIGFAFKITGTYDYSKCGASINCVITFA